MTAIPRIQREVPFLRDVSNLLDKPITKVALSVLSGLAVAFSLVSGKLWLALLPAGYLLYQGYQFINAIPDIALLMLAAFVAQETARCAAETPEPTGLRGGSGRTRRPGGEDHVPVGRGHTATPDPTDPQLLARTARPRAPVGH